MVKGQEKKVYRLCKALYGLKQAPRAWYENMHAYLVNKGFKNNPTESTLYVKHCDGVILVVTLFVDDLMVTGNDEKKTLDFKPELSKSYEMSDLGLLHYYLGAQFLQTDKGI